MAFLAANVSHRIHDREGGGMASFGILVGGGPAPGINGVIGAAAILARRRGAHVLGIPNGFAGLMQGDIRGVRELHIAEVSRIHQLGGSVLQTSRADPSRDDAALARTLDALGRLGVDHLITIGGDGTAHAARAVAERGAPRLRVAHVPKTIDNDLPLPAGIPTFGFETAREEGARIVARLMEDARTTARWYVVVMMGRTAGHLALGAAKSAGATLALVAEEFAAGPIRLERVARTIEAAIVKRFALGRPHGVAVVAEGIGERLAPEDLAQDDHPRDEHGRVRHAEIPLGELLAERAERGAGELGIQLPVIAKDVGYELRCAAPNAFDAEYTRDLGSGAVRVLLAGGSGVMITRQEHAIVPIPFDAMRDAATGRMRVRLLDTASPIYETARSLQVRLDAEDLAPGRVRDAICATTRLTPTQLEARFAHVCGS
jgi:6-phosphofructokinase 1